MTPEHTALVARLERINTALYPEAAAVIRALAGEVERLKQDLAHDRHQWNLAVSDAEEARAEVAALKIDNQTLRDLLAVAEERDEL